MVGLGNLGAQEPGAHIIFSPTTYQPPPSRVLRFALAAVIYCTLAVMLVSRGIRMYVYTYVLLACCSVTICACMYRLYHCVCISCCIHVHVLTAMCVYTYVRTYVYTYVCVCMYVHWLSSYIVECIHVCLHCSALIRTYVVTYIRMYLLHVRTYVLAACTYMSPRVYMFVYTADHEMSDLPPLLPSLCPLPSPASLPLYVHTYVCFLLCRGYMCCWSMKGSLNTS